MAVVGGLPGRETQPQRTVRSSHFTQVPEQFGILLLTTDAQQLGTDQVRQQTERGSPRTATARQDPTRPTGAVQRVVPTGVATPRESRPPQGVRITAGVPRDRIEGFEVDVALEIRELVGLVARHAGEDHVLVHGGVQQFARTVEGVDHRQQPIESAVRRRRGAHFETHAVERHDEGGLAAQWRGAGGQGLQQGVAGGVGALQQGVALALVVDNLDGVETGLHCLGQRGWRGARGLRGELGGEQQDRGAQQSGHGRQPTRHRLSRPRAGRSARSPRPASPASAGASRSVRRSTPPDRWQSAG